MYITCGYYCNAILLIYKANDAMTVQMLMHCLMRVPVSVPTFDKYLYGTCGSVHSCCLAFLSLKTNSYDNSGESSWFKNYVCKWQNPFLPTRRKKRFDYQFIYTIKKSNNNFLMGISILMLVYCNKSSPYRYTEFCIEMEINFLQGHRQKVIGTSRLV